MAFTTNSSGQVPGETSNHYKPQDGKLQARNQNIKSQQQIKPSKDNLKAQLQVGYTVPGWRSSRQTHNHNSSSSTSDGDFKNLPAKAGHCACCRALFTEHQGNSDSFHSTDISHAASTSHWSLLCIQFTLSAELAPNFLKHFFDWPLSIYYLHH